MSIFLEYFSEASAESAGQTGKKEGINKMRLEMIQNYLKERGWNFQYSEEDGLGSVDFEHRGLSYHIWEFEEDGVFGAETNLRTSGRTEDMTGNYEEQMIEIMKSW